jgi:hypothetical protein
MYRERACADCGVVFSPTGPRQRRCLACGTAAVRSSGSGTTMVSFSRPPIECRGCGLSVPDRRGSVRREFCSQACSHAWRTLWRRENPKLGPWLSEVLPSLVPRDVVCGFCEMSFEHRGSSRRQFCSEWCRRAVGGHVPLSFSIYPAHCRRCGKCYIGTDDRQEYCSRVCTRRAGKNRRKHLERTALRVGESFTLREIAERDGWRCHLCHKKVPDREYAARDRDPTMDHLIPLSEGGTHTRLNVALAHNRCNWERSASGAAQLRLVA